MLHTIALLCIIFFTNGKYICACNVSTSLKLNVFGIVEAGRKKKGVHGSSADELKSLFKRLLCMVFAPVILWFLYSIANDPDVVWLVKQIFVRLGKRTYGYLGTTKKGSEQQQVHEQKFGNQLHTVPRPRRPIQRDRLGIPIRGNTSDTQPLWSRQRGTQLA